MPPIQKPPEEHPPCRKCGKPKMGVQRGHYKGKWYDKMYSTCLECRKSRKEAWYTKNREHALEYARVNKRSRETERRFNLRRKLKAHGLTFEQYEKILEVQDYSCAICGESRYSVDDRALHFDHNHETGKFRGLLCGPCNCALGLLKEDPKRISKMLVYLEVHNQNSEAVVWP